MKYIYVMLLLFATSASSQTIGLVKDKKTAEKTADYIIRPPKMNYAALCQENNLLNDANIAQYLLEEAEGRLNAETYYHLAKIYYHGLGAVFQNHAKAMDYAQNAADIPSIWRKKSRNLVGRMQLKALKNGDESQRRELQNTIDMMRQEDGYSAGYYAGQLSEMEEDYALAFTHYRSGAAKNPQASLAIAALYFANKLPNGSVQKTTDMIKIGQNQLLGELNEGDCNALMPMADMFLNGKVMKPQTKVGLEWLQVALDSGYGSAGARLGEHYMEKKKPEMARNVWQQASNLGSKRAMFLLGDDALDAGKTKAALKLFKQSAKLNYMPAISRLMEIYQGNHGKQYADEQKLQQWKAKASAAPTPPSELLREMGLSLRIKGDYANSLQTLQRAAYGGSKQSWLDLAVAHRYGYGVRQDLAKSFQHTQRGAKAGSSAAAYALSEHYYCGIGVKENAEQADFWRNEAQKRNDSQKLDAPLQNKKSKNAQAEHFLLLQNKWRNDGLMPEDLIWLQVAADTHHKQSTMLLGDVYKAADYYDAKLAHKYYEMAAMLGSQAAMLRLAAIGEAQISWIKRADDGVLCDGEVLFDAANYYELKGDASKAKQYLQASAKRGNAKALHNLSQQNIHSSLIKAMN